MIIEILRLLLLVLFNLFLLLLRFRTKTPVLRVANLIPRVYRQDLPVHPALVPRIVPFRPVWRVRFVVRGSVKAVSTKIIVVKIVIAFRIIVLGSLVSQNAKTKHKNKNTMLIIIKKKKR